MSAASGPAFRCTTIVDATDLPCANPADVLAIARRLPEWDAATIIPESGDFPRADVTWHEGHGFVVHCFENDASWGYFLARNEPLSAPIVDIVLVPHRERWPSQLFVSPQMAAEALEVFLATGTQKATLRWIRNGAFERA